MTFTRQIGRNKKDQHTKKRKRTKIIHGSNSILVEKHENLSKNTDILRKLLKSKRKDLDRRTHKSL